MSSGDALWDEEEESASPLVAAELGGLGRSFNAIKNYFRGHAFGSSDARKGQNAHSYWYPWARNCKGAWRKKEPGTGKTCRNSASISGASAT